jgi:outer membrane protein TolC
MALSTIARFTYSRQLGSLILAAVLGGVTVPVLSEEPPLTLKQAQRIAIERSRQLDAKDYAIYASEELAVAARQLPDPVLSAGIENLPISGADRWRIAGEPMTMRRIGIAQELTRANKRRLRGSLYELQAQEIAAEKGTVLADVEQDTALAWLNRHYAEAMAAVIAEQREQAQTELEAAQAAYRGGRGTQADIVEARSALVEIDNRANEMARRIRNANTLLARWVGEAASRPIVGQPPINELPFDPTLVDAHIAHHPLIAAMAKRHEIAVAEAKLAQAEKKADWTVGLTYSQRGGGHSDMVSVGVSVPLQWNQKNRQDREVAAKLAMAQQAKAELEEMLRAHVAEAQTMVNEWREMRERHAKYQDELIPLASERTAAVLAAYRGGKSSLSDVLMARRNEIDVRLQALALETDIAQLWAELAFLFPSQDLAWDSAAVINGDMK